MVKNIILLSILIIVGIVSFIWMKDIAFSFSISFYGVVLIIKLIRGFDILKIVRYENVRSIVQDLDSNKSLSSNQKKSLTNFEVLKMGDIKLCAEGHIRAKDSDIYRLEFDDHLLKWLLYSFVPLLITFILSYSNSQIDSSVNSDTESVYNLTIYLKIVLAILPTFYLISYHNPLILYLRKRNRIFISSTQH